MFKEIKKHRIFIIAFMIINFIVLNAASILSEPIEVGDLVAPMFLVFQITAILSSFFAAIIITLVLVSKTSDFKEQLSVIMVSVLIFSVIGFAVEFSSFFLLQEKDWEQGYLTEVLVQPYEITLEQFKTLTFFNGVKQLFVSITGNSGAAFFGFLIGRKIMEKNK